MGRRKKKKRKSTPPKRWNFNRKKRLGAAKGWMQTYEGKYLIKGYTRRYKVDILCAIVELRMLGVAISEEYENQVKRSVEDRIRAKQLKKQQQAEAAYFADYVDEGFYFVAGYTSGGAPYGLTCEQMDAINREEEED